MHHSPISINVATNHHHYHQRNKNIFLENITSNIGYEMSSGVMTKTKYKFLYFICSTY